MVEWKKIDDVIVSLKTGLNPRANFVLNTPGSKIPYITGKDIFENRINISDKTDMIDEKALNLINKRACLEDNLLLFASTGTGTVGRMAIIEKYNNDWGMSETLYAIKTKDFISPYFLMYCLYSHNCKSQFEPKISKGSVPHLKVVDLLNVQIPIPSIQEQQRIVGILNTFTSSIDNLKKQIAQRRKQYEYYRDQLLDLEGKPGVEMKTLGELCKIKNGYTPSTKEPSYWENGTLPWFTLEDIRINGRILKDAIKHITPLGVKRGGLFPKGSVIVSTTATIGEYALIETAFLCNQQITCISIKDSYKNILSEKFLYHLSQRIGEWCKKNVNGGGSLLIVSTSKLNKLQIPLPPLSELRRIVSILDTFESSIRNLEAQLSQREKQYEYYRNKLLTFE